MVERPFVALLFAILACVVGAIYGWPYDMAVLLVSIIVSEFMDYY